MAEVHNSGILLESGTNEIEIMEFTIDGSLYGINVAKVREIILSAPVKVMPHAHPAVEGIFKPRDAVITVVDLPRYLGVEKEKGEKDLFIITNFNKMFIAFRVHTVVGISRISWTDIHKPDKTVSGGSEGVATGIAQCGDDLVTILDFERIVAEIAPETTIQMDEIDKMGPRDRRAETICPSTLEPTGIPKHSPKVTRTEGAGPTTTCFLGSLMAARTLAVSSRS